ncbi:uncharacterized protein IL334_005515 [Kwoniella shivajii]|uniref:Copper-fist domain-containing protein n=1 Tax=Kwoniella shivajii TaxID=564305 RepID=A0ABZ1D3N8_9TREE|nr:hypothetical protein IL334_005515 [Kwoniella shivajii]
MVLINEKKYACDKCIKGHRVTGCTHTDRPLYEIKKKGRPTTQCSCCKEKRKSTGSSVHNKCICGDTKKSSTTNSTIPPAASPSTASHVQIEQALSSNAAEQMDEYDEFELETRKGQPGSKATFPRGFKDVLELAAAANALAGMVEEDSAFKVAERSVSALLNPCKCESGGQCKCCLPKKKNANADSLDIPDDPPASGAHDSSSSGSIIPRPIPAPILNPYLSPGNMHHPAHTSPHVHKTKLYSPYSINPASQSRHGRRDTISSARSSGRASPVTKSSRPPTRIKPLTDFGRLIGAALNQDGTLNKEIPRSAVGLPRLPGIQTFDVAAENGGTKIEAMEMEQDIDMPLAFPTNEEVVIGACCCGEDCECPGCATHDNSGVPAREHDHEGGNSCGEGCKGRHDCNHSIAVPSGVRSIAQLISLAASQVPPPPETQHYSSLDPHDIRMLPSSAQLSEDAARTLGMVQLKPLECCNGRCQCAAGQCTCEKDCCGCCVRCACSEEDEDARMNEDEHPPPNEIVQPAAKSSCCSGKNSVPQFNTVQTNPPNLALALPAPIPVQPPSTLLSPENPRPSSIHSQQPSPVHSGTTTPTHPVSGAVRRATSTSSKNRRESHDTPSSLHRRATVTGNPLATTGPSKTTAKSIAAQNVQLHRTILPKPTASHLAVKTSINGNNDTRQSSPAGNNIGITSAGQTRSTSPTGAEINREFPNFDGQTSGSQAQNLPLPTSVPVPAALHMPSPMNAMLGSYQWHPQAQESGPQPMFTPRPEVQNGRFHQYESHPPSSTQVPVSSDLATSSDHNIDPWNAALLAFLHNYPQSNSTTSQTYLDATNTMNDQWFTQPPGLQAASSGDTSPELDQPIDIEQFIAQALMNQQSQQQAQPMPVPDPDLVSANQSGPSHTDFDPGFNDCLLNSSLFTYQDPNASTESHSITPHFPSSQGYIPQPQPLLQDASSETGPRFIPMVPGLSPDITYSPNWTSATAKEDIVQEEKRKLDELRANVDSRISPLHQPPQQQQHAPTQRQFEIPGGDIIDLSKPLDANALSKIMQALQKHGEQLPAQAPDSLPPQAPPPPPPASQMSTLSYDQSNLNDISTAGHGGSTNTSNTTKELDDMFNQFVTLDGISSNPQSIQSIDPLLDTSGNNGAWIGLQDMDGMTGVGVAGWERGGGMWS